MARQRKKRRTQAAGSVQNSRAQGLDSNRTASSANPESRIPKSMVLRMGGSKIGPSVSQLALDVRSVMEPHTASKLRERKTNKLRDFTTMARPLGVSHILAFYRSEKSGNVNLNIIVSPRGPTFSFRVETYSLARDVVKMQKRPKASGGETHAPPLLVMNNFKTLPTSTDSTSSSKPSKPSKSTEPEAKVPKHLEDLAISVFQSMFPAVQPQKTPLDTVKRVLLLNRIPPNSKDDEGTYTLQFRHYAITTKKVLHLSKGIKRLRAAEKFAKSAPYKSQPERPNLIDPREVHSGKVSATATTNGAESDSFKKKKNGGLPNLHNLDDVADYILDPSAMGYTSASETEADTDAEVEVLQSDTRKVLNRKARQRLSHPNTTNTHTSTSIDQPQEHANHQRSKVEKRAIKLSELGPRMTLRLIKVQEGVADGRVLWHEYISKSAAEEKQLDKMHEQRRVEKEERRRVQKENVERKKAEKGGKSGKDGDEEGDEDDEEMDDEDWDDLDEDEEMLDDDDEEEEEDEGEDEGEMEDEEEEDDD